MSRYIQKLNLSRQMREKLTYENQKRIADLYSNIDIAPEDYSTIAELKQLQKQLDNDFAIVARKTAGIITTGMTIIAVQTLRESSVFPRRLGMPANMNFNNKANGIVNNILKGKVYSGNWSLSDSIWRDLRKNQADINAIIVKGIENNRSALDIAKDLEKYVNPFAKKPWDWNKVYPGTKTKIDYNAQRLSRTMVSHAYQESLTQSGKANPFCNGFRWQISNSDRVCLICTEREGKTFPKDKLPFDHPNGMCTFEVVIDFELEDTIERIADWFSGKSDHELDTWSDFLNNQ